MSTPIPGIKVLLEGETDAGKTTAIKTLVEAGLTPMCIFTDPNFAMLNSIPPEKLHWRYIPAVKANFQKFVDVIGMLKVQTPKMVQEGQDSSRQFDNPFDPILQALMKFKCDRDGKEYGNAGDWGTDKVLVIDTLTGLTEAAKQYTVGTKYAWTQPEYQIVMGLIKNLINQIIQGFPCHFVMTAHLEREYDEVTGSSRIYSATIGKKLAPQIPIPFSDVVWAKSDGREWWWCTRDPSATLKAKFAERNEKIPASFVPLVAKWRALAGQT